jgi:hypothetical protein
MENSKYINELLAKNERKKAGNVINQRAFRKRMKNRMDEVMNQNNTENLSSFIEILNYSYIGIFFILRFK